MSLPPVDDTYRIALLQTLADEFWTPAAGQGALILQALMQCDWATVRRQTHTLKGTAAILGVEHVSLLAAALEAAATAPRPNRNRAIDLAADLSAAMAALRRSLPPVQPARTLARPEAIAA